LGFLIYIENQKLRGQHEVPAKCTVEISRLKAMLAGKHGSTAGE